jgi:Secretion system C-terminal sorting domain
VFVRFFGSDAPVPRLVAQDGFRQVYVKSCKLLAKIVFIVYFCGFEIRANVKTCPPMKVPPKTRIELAAEYSINPKTLIRKLLRAGIKLPIVLTHLACFYNLFAVAQPGFNRRVDIGYFTNQFRNLIVHHDTIVGYGMAYTQFAPPRKQCLFVARFDSSSVPIDHKLICDPLGGFYSVDINWGDIIQTSDGGYALVGASFTRYDGLFVKLKKDLSIDFIQEYPDKENQVEFYSKIIELGDGYLLTGHMQRPNYLQDAFLRRVDKKGQSLWYKFYGQYHVFDLFQGYWQMNDSMLVCGGGYAKDPQAVAGRGPWIAFINMNSGNIVREWKPERVPVEAMQFIYPMKNGGWFFYGKKAVPVRGEIGGDSYFCQINSNFEITHVRSFITNRTYPDFFFDVEPTPDGHFIGAGQILIPSDNPAFGPTLAGWLYKFKANTDSIWSLRMIAPPAEPRGVRPEVNRLGGVGILSSGNMVAGGYIEVPNNILCWLVKVTPDGCVDTLFCARSPRVSAWQTIEEQSASVRMWPNPVSETLYVDIPESGHFHLQLWTADGRLVRTLESDERTMEISVAGLPQGVCFMHLRDAKGRVTARKVMVNGI